MLLVGAVPQSVDVGVGLSAPTADAVEAAAAEIVAELARVGIELRARRRRLASALSWLGRRDTRPPEVPDTMFASMLLFGFLLGLRHALDADHVAAVAALSTRSTSPRDLLRLAAGWGTGHTLTILAAGAVAITIGATLSAAGEAFLERMVGVVLVAMGGDVLRRAIGRGLHAACAPARGRDPPRAFPRARRRARRAPSTNDHAHGNTGRALAMGTLHGLAGSAALLLIALPQARSAVEAMACLATFGIGSIAGMLAFSLALSFPLRVASRKGGTMIGLEGVLGSATLLVGLRILSS